MKNRFEIRRSIIVSSLGALLWITLTSIKADNYAVTQQDLYDLLYNTNGGDPNGRVWHAKTSFTGDSKCMTKDEANALIDLDQRLLPPEGNKLVLWQQLSPVFQCGDPVHYYIGGTEDSIGGNDFSFDLGTANATVTVSVTGYPIVTGSNNVISVIYGGSTLATYTIPANTSSSSFSFNYVYNGLVGSQVQIKAINTAGGDAVYSFNVSLSCVPVTQLKVFWSASGTVIEFDLKKDDMLFQNPCYMAISFNYSFYCRKTDGTTTGGNGSVSIPAGSSHVYEYTNAPSGSTINQVYIMTITPASCGSYTIERGN